MIQRFEEFPQGVSAGLRSTSEQWKMLNENNGSSIAAFVKIFGRDRRMEAKSCEPRPGSLTRRSIRRIPSWTSRSKTCSFLKGIWIIDCERYGLENGNTHLGFGAVLYGLMCNFNYLHYSMLSRMHMRSRTRRKERTPRPTAWLCLERKATCRD